MPQFRYEARDPEGAVIAGFIEANTRAQALLLLRQQRLLVDVLVEAQEYRKQQTRAERASWGQGPLYPLWPIRPSSIALFFDQLGRLLSAGVTPHDAFSTLESRVGGRLSRVARDGAAALAQGGTVSEHLSRYPRFFPPHIIAIMRSGELSGFLHEACQEIVHDCETEQMVRKRVLFIKLWVGFHLLACVLIAPFPWAMARGVPQQLEQTTTTTDSTGDDMGLGLNITGSSAMDALRPGLTVYAGVLMRKVLPLLLAVWLASLMVRVIVNLPALASARDWVRVHVPVAAGATRRAAVARFMRTFELMQRAAVPISEAVRQAAMATGNSLVARRVAAPAASLGHGGRLSDALAAARIFGPAELSLIATAEQSGTLSDGLGQLSAKARKDREDYLNLATRGGCVAGVLVTAIFIAFAMLIGYMGIAQMYDEFFKAALEG